MHRCREDLREALTSLDPDPIIVGYLALARALIDDRRLQAAACELETGIATLSHASPAALWRLDLSLAAVRDGLADPIGARRATLEAHAHAVSANNQLGRSRARALLRRLDAARARSR